jgi:16S rRNA (cytidine1402-2'-O)-methyltransferase
LLDKYLIDTPLISYRDQNHEKMICKILEKLDMGMNLVLISDAGTPLISDPGFRLVKELLEKEYSVISIPGPSALTSAISISGLPTDKFVFLGFLLKSDERRKKLLKEYFHLENSIVIYESPKRLLRLLRLVFNEFGDREVFLAKDISKLREEIFKGNVSDILKELEKRDFEKNPHGEFVCIFR